MQTDMTIIRTYASRAGIIILCMLAGYFALRAGSAAGLNASSEAESGVVNGNAAVQSDATASGGAKAVFGTAPDGRAFRYGASGNGNPKTSDCTVDVAAGQNLQAAVNAAAVGSVVCVKPANRSAESLTLNKKVNVRANGQVSIRNVVISGDGAILDGFSVVGGSAVGIAYKGTNHVIRDNIVSGRGITTGISCDDCGSGHVITNNTITGIQNYGFIISNGDRITVEKNNVYDLWASTTTDDVDVMRYWGTNHMIRDNYFHDINEFKSARYDDGDTPHVDCFQTFQTGDGRVVRDITIENNYCVRISRQCIIMSNHLRGTYDIRDIVIRGNVCETYDSSVVNLGSVAGITMENNFFLGGVKAQVLTVDYTREENPAGLPDKDIRLRNNIVMKGTAGASYFYQNSTRTLTDNTDNLLVQNNIVKANADSFQGQPNASYAAQRPADFTQYRQLAGQYPVVDQGSSPLSTGFVTEIDGGPRQRGASIDIGPFEHR